MGADLYIDSLFAATRAEWQPKVTQAERARDTAVDEDSRAAAQARVESTYALMFGRGYFRDSYNDANLLWKFDLAWWDDISPMLDDDCRLSPKRAEHLRRMLDERLNKFEAAIRQFDESDQQYFRAKYAKLDRFLQEAVELDEPILCSL